MADWDATFLPALQALLSGGDIYAYLYNPPWVLFPLIPFAFLPRVFLLAIEITVLGLVARKLGAKPLTMGVLLLSPLAINALAFGNVEWLALLGILLPTPLGVLFLLIKPQVGGAVALFLIVETWRIRGTSGVVRTLAPLAIALSLSLVFFGAWPLRLVEYSRFSNSPVNLSLFPYSIPVGLALVIYSMWKRKLAFALAASPCFAPVLTPQCWLVVLLALSSLPVESTMASAGLWLARYI